MNFSKVQVIFRFYGFSSLFRPILPMAFAIAGNFTSEMYFWIFFWSIWSLVHIKKSYIFYKMQIFKCLISYGFIVEISLKCQGIERVNIQSCRHYIKHSGTCKPMEFVNNNKTTTLGSFLMSHSCLASSKTQNKASYGLVGEFMGKTLVAT